MTSDGTHLRHLCNESRCKPSWTNLDLVVSDHHPCGYVPTWLMKPERHRKLEQTHKDIAKNPMNSQVPAISLEGIPYPHVCGEAKQ